ncbi:MAG TPA: winged helix-turn-helix domain-containing protein [Microvirga sp.]|jgi:predicted ATPase|nr:winged helix-turn-helix domain-containing protein [Microvirga sp.]
MDTGLIQHSASTICFGPFTIRTKERLLLKGDTPVELGARALDLLVALVSRPNETLTKQELLSRVWPDVTVEEASLRVHVAALRKALGDGEDGARYILTLAGRGYCFVAPVTVVADGAPSPARSVEPAPDALLPARLRRMVGRDSSIRTLAALLSDSRFVTIVGTGGVGKTTLAIAVAHDLLESFGGDVFFVDLGALSDPALVAPSVASLLRLSVQSDDPTPSLLAFLRDKRMLLVLDNCEHLIETAAALAMRIYLAAPHVHILATSREALRVEGEQLYKLMPLTVPPDDLTLTAKSALTYSAVQLFIERVSASGTHFELTDHDAVTIATICRKLDGLALAIELAAARVGTYGLQRTLALLDQRLTMLWLGQRTAPPRQKTLRAMLDWSYELLSETERVVLRRLAVFVGPFTVEAALAVVANAATDEETVFAAIETLIAKSMVVVQPTGGTMRYRLSETTRAYALEIAIPDAERGDLAARHASYFRSWLQDTSGAWTALPHPPNRVSLLADLGNIRAALEWCFSPGGRADIGVQLAAAAAPLFLALSLLTECLRWAERALLVHQDSDAEEMRLQAALGMSWMFTRGNGEPAHTALKRSLDLATRRGDISGELRSLSLLHMYYRRISDYRATLTCAERGSVLAAMTGSTPAIALAHSLLGVSLYHVGDLTGARTELESALKLQQGTDWTSIFLLGFDHYNLSGSILARTLWLQGFPTQAVDVARRSVREAVLLDHPVTMSIALTWALSVFMWTGDLGDAEEMLAKSLTHAEAHTLTPNVIQGRGFRGALALRRGDPDRGIRELKECLSELRATRYGLLGTPFSIALADGLVQMGRSAEAIAVIDTAVEVIKGSGELVYMPELLRAKGSALAAAPEAGSRTAEVYFLQALDWSRRHGSLSCELRAAIDFATYLADHERIEEARGLLQPVLDAFTEGHQTEDLVTAARLLSRLS